MEGVPVKRGPWCKPQGVQRLRGVGSGRSAARRPSCLPPLPAVALSGRLQACAARVKARATVLSTDRGPSRHPYHAPPPTCRTAVCWPGPGPQRSTAGLPNPPLSPSLPLLCPGTAAREALAPLELKLGQIPSPAHQLPPCPTQLQASPCAALEPLQAAGRLLQGPNRVLSSSSALPAACLPTES